MGWGGYGKGKDYGYGGGYDDYGSGYDGGSVFGGGGYGGWSNNAGFQAFKEMLRSQVSPMKGKGGHKGGFKGKGKGARGASTTEQQNVSRLKNIEADRKVFVSGLPTGVNWKLIAEHFVEVKPELTQSLSDSTACIAFASAEQALSAAADLGGSDFNGNTIQVDLWTPDHDVLMNDRPSATEDGEKRKRPASETFDHSKQLNLAKKNAAKVNAVEDNCKVLISSLTETTHWKELKSHCDENGVAPEMVVIHDSCQGVVTFLSPSSASVARNKLNDTILSGNCITASAWDGSEVDAKKVKVL